MFKKIFYFYYNWFKNLKKDSKILWLLIFAKTTIILIVLLTFFPDFLWQFETKEEKSDAVSKSLLNIK